MIVVSVDDPNSLDAQLLLDELSETLSEITGSSGKASFNVADVQTSGALFVIARDSSASPLGCGAFRPINNDVAELKRMYARAGTTNVGSSILQFLEQAAKLHGYSSLWLETRVVNKRAVKFYTEKGYRRIENFGKYTGRPEAICMEKKFTKCSASAQKGL